MYTGIFHLESQRDWVRDGSSENSGPEGHGSPHIGQERHASPHIRH